MGGAQDRVLGVGCRGRIHNHGSVRAVIAFDAATVARSPFGSAALVRTNALRSNGSSALSPAVRRRATVRLTGIQTSSLRVRRE